MKPIYNPAEVQFVRMKDTKLCKASWWKYIVPHPGGGFMATTGDLDSLKPTDGHGFYGPFLPGEKVYLKEAWLESHDMDECGCVYLKSEFQDGKVPEHLRGRYVWRSPVTMPQRAASRFFTVVSCTPMQKDGEWVWRIEVKED